MARKGSVSASLQANLRHVEMMSPEDPVLGPPAPPRPDFRMLTGMGLSAESFQHPQYRRAASNPANARRTPKGSVRIPVGRMDLSGVPSMSDVEGQARFLENAKTLRLIRGSRYDRLRGVPSDPVENFAIRQMMDADTKNAMNRSVSQQAKDLILDRILIPTGDWGPDAGPSLPRDAAGRFPAEPKERIETRVHHYKTEVAAERAVQSMMRPAVGRPAQAAKITPKPRMSAGKKPVTTSFDPMIVPQEKRPSARVGALNKGRIDAITFAGGSLNLGLLGSRGPVR